MAQRADFVIVKKGKATAYFDKWGDLGCLSAFADGPESALEFTSHMKKISKLDAVFAEGGYLLDFDQKIAIVFGSPVLDDDFDEQAKQINDALGESELAYLNYVANVWTGWKLTWDYAGVESFVKYLKEQEITAIGLLPCSNSSYMPPPPISLQA